MSTFSKSIVVVYVCVCLSVFECVCAHVLVSVVREKNIEILCKNSFL